MSKVADPVGMCAAAKSRGFGRRSRVAAVFVIAALALVPWCS